MKTGAAISKNIFGEGTIPRITATSLNNGISLFTDNCQHKNFREAQNVISYSFLGDVFYHPYKLSLDMKIHFFSLKSRSLNQYIGLFLVQCLKNSIVDPSYGNQISIADLKKMKINLPINIGGSPNWDYMEQYIINRMKTIDVPELEPIKSSSIDLKSVQWKEFEIEQVFDQINSVKGKSIDNYPPGKVPYITTSAINNGLTNYILTDKEIITSGNVITIDPIKGKAFYHIYNFVGRGGAGSAINVLKSMKLNKNIGLFLTTMIESNSFLKASYGTQLNGKRLKKQKIMLPVTSENTPNWQFMEDYIKSISNSYLL